MRNRKNEERGRREEPTTVEKLATVLAEFCNVTTKTNDRFVRRCNVCVSERTQQARFRNSENERRPQTC